jgi:nucleoside-diphosphate-sugar epimerase
MACALEVPRERVHGQIFNVGHTRQNYQVREIAELIAEAFPGSRLLLGSNDADRRSYRVSFEKIRAGLPGFDAVHDARAGAAELRALFERVGLSRDAFEHRAYTRVRQLMHLRGAGAIDGRLFWRAGARAGRPAGVETA